MNKRILGLVALLAGLAAVVVAFTVLASCEEPSKPAEEPDEGFKFAVQSQPVEKGKGWSVHFRWAFHQKSQEPSPPPAQAMSQANARRLVIALGVVAIGLAIASWVRKEGVRLGLVSCVLGVLACLMGTFAVAFTMIGVLLLIALFSGGAEVLLFFLLPGLGKKRKQESGTSTVC